MIAEIPPFLDTPEKISHVLQFVRNEGKCPYCVQYFHGIPETLEVADHISQCVRKSELKEFG